MARQIAGLSTLKGLVLYSSVGTFMGFYAYFMEQVTTAHAGSPPSLVPAMVTAAAALSGIFGSAFALVIGVPASKTNEVLKQAVDAQQTRGVRAPAAPGSPRVVHGWPLHLWRGLSLEPAGSSRASIPLTVGVWAYALVAGAVAAVYFVCPGETPPELKTLATAFAGYVVALLTMAYGLGGR